MNVLTAREMVAGGGGVSSIAVGKAFPSQETVAVTRIGTEC